MTSTLFRSLAITLTLGAAPLLNAYHKYDIFNEIERNRIAAVRELLEQGADVNIFAGDLQGFARNESWNRLTPLTFATRLGNVDIVELLLTNGADIEGATDNGNRPLMAAASCHRFKLIETLLKHGANINAQNEDGKTALMIAIENTDYTSVSILLKHNADVTVQDKNKQTALAYAKKTLAENELKANYAYYDNNYNDNGYELGLCEISTSIIELLKAHGATE